MSFSALERTQHLASLTGRQWDLLIIGGGITGAGILLDAVSRGLKVALIEKGDFASGTSSRSTKLIHGGLRYLKNFEIGLVREVGRERAIVYANARHLVRPEPMLLPIYHDGSIGRITGSIGLWFYDLLADVDKTERRKMLSREETIMHEPLLRQEGLLGSGLYYEYRTDDARLTLSILKKAVSLGALALNYCEATGFIYDEDQVTGVRCKDIFTMQEMLIHANVVVNATGPWMDDVMNLHQQSPSNEKKLLLTKGVHIVIPKSKIPISQSMYFDVPADGRMIFCIPRDQSVYIGTTDTVYEGQLDDLEVCDEEVAYLIQACNHVMENVTLGEDDVTGSWAGLRPLINEDGKSPSELSRKDEIFVSPNGLISIAGGKLTGYRKMAERIVDLVLKSPRLKDLQKIECRTEDIRLAGAEFNSEQDLQLMVTSLYEEYSLFEKAQIAKLFFRYGDETAGLLSTAKSLTALSPEDALVEAEVAFAIHHEMAQHLPDFLFRRTSDVFFDPEYLKHRFMKIASVFARMLNWNEMRCLEETREVEQALHK